jgi:hypothetical protein
MTPQAAKVQSPRSDGPELTVIAVGRGAGHPKARAFKADAEPVRGAPAAVPGPGCRSCRLTDSRTL